MVPATANLVSPFDPLPVAPAAPAPTMPVILPPLPATPNFGRTAVIAVALLAALPPMPAVHAAGAVEPAPTMPRPPNILFVISDDQSWRDTGIGGERTVRTPAFDRIAREGGRFTHAFCASPSCTPSRSAVRTGRHLGQIGKAGVLSGTLPHEFPVFPHLLPAAGYNTGFTGKGRGPGEWPAGGLTRHPLGREKRLADVTVPPDWPDTAEVRRDLLDYAREIDWFDAQLAKMIAQLETLGELEHTLVVVTSDNGMPLPRAKTIRCDPGVRMPFAVRWPGRIPAGRVVDDFVRHLDFAPTFLEAAGADAPAAFTGRSLLPLLTSRAAGGVDPTRDAAHTALERHTWC